MGNTSSPTIRLKLKFLKDHLIVRSLQDRQIQRRLRHQQRRLRRLNLPLTIVVGGGYRCLAIIQDGVPHRLLRLPTRQIALPSEPDTFKGVLCQMDA
jgi:hypothetical protein